jgi:hypothetical protein
MARSHAMQRTARKAGTDVRVFAAYPLQMASRIVDERWHYIRMRHGYYHLW